MMPEDPRAEPWFDGQPRSSRPSVPPIALPSRARTIYAGLAAGAIAGAGGITLAWIAAKRSGVDLVASIGRAVSYAPLRAVPVLVRGLVPSFAIAVVIGIIVALLTRHVKRAIPVSIFAMIFTPAVWLGVHVLALHRAPGLAAALPLGPMLLGWATFGALLGTAVAIRG